MKKFAAMIVAVLLACALAASALAVSVTMYATQDDVKVYEKKSTKSDVVDTLSSGQAVAVKRESEDGKWYAVQVDYGELLIDGWAQAKYLSADPPEEEPEHEHKWTKWEVVREATCTETGLKTRYCKVCGEHQEREIEKIDHDYSRWYEVRPATCVEEGEQVRWCKVCGQEDTEIIDMLPHEFGEWVMTRQPTCTLEGLRAHWCLNCDTREEEPIAKLPHSFGLWAVTTEATDHSAGIRSKLCKVCGYAQQESFDPEGTLRRGSRGDGVREIQQLLIDQGYLRPTGVDGVYGPGTEKAVSQFQTDQGIRADGVAWPQTIELLRHDFGKWRTVTKLTRTTDGVRVRTCTKCGYEERVTVAAGAPILRRARGENVRVVQKMLNDLGYNAGTADGAYGPKLDAAFMTFAVENDITDFTENTLRPGDVDALVNAWIAMESQLDWMGQGSRGTDVNLILTVTSAGNASGGMQTFNWSLTNTGTQSCRAYAVLMGFGSDCDFMADNLAMAVDGTVLKANGGNRVSGTFSAATEWAGDADALAFRAVGVSEKTGAKWVSNVRTFPLSDK